MIEEQFSTGTSFVHSLDPRIKIIVAALFSVLVAVSENFLALVPALAISVLTISLAKLSIQTVLYRLLLVNGLIFFLWLVLPFTYGGESCFVLGPLVATKEGIAYATKITVKSNTILLCMIALLGTIPISTLGHAMSRLSVPDKLVHLLLFTYRYIHVIFQEYRRLINAMKIRGFTPRTNNHTYKTYAYLLGALLVRSYDRAERIHKAMLCRGFAGRYYTSTPFSVKARDLYYLSVMMTIIFGLVFLQWSTTI